MRAPLAAGARFVLLDGAVARVDMTQDEIGLAFNWQSGPAHRPLGDPSYAAATHAFTGRGLRPFSPVHVRGARDGSGNLTITWVRRTRIGGDSWEGTEVPLGEDSESYEIDILDGSDVKRTLSTTAASVVYTAADQTTDFGALQASVHVRVTQMSAVLGRGTPRDATI
jgi:hypothetical protein